MVEVYWREQWNRAPARCGCMPSPSHPTTSICWCGHGGQRSRGFWERRYSAEPVLDDTALVGRLRYVLAHGVKEGLVERCAEWQGHASTRQAPRELRERYRDFVSAFREAAARWRQGDFSACFPRFSFPPRVVPGRIARVL